VSSRVALRGPERVASPGAERRFVGAGRAPRGESAWRLASAATEHDAPRIRRCSDRAIRCPGRTDRTSVPAAVVDIARPGIRGEQTRHETRAIRGSPRESASDASGQILRYAGRGPLAPDALLSHATRSSTGRSGQATRPPPPPLMHLGVGRVSHGRSGALRAAPTQEDPRLHVLSGPASQRRIVCVCLLLFAAGGPSRFSDVRICLRARVSVRDPGGRRR
jgi:hypothetical protein